MRAWAAICLLVGIAQADTSVRDRSDHLIVRARLVAGHAADTPHCGLSYVAEVMRWELIRIIEGHYEGRTLYVLHGCAEMVGVGEGDEYTLTLTKTRPGAITVIDRFGDQKAPRLWLNRLDGVSGRCGVLAGLQTECPHISITVGSKGELPPPSVTILGELAEELLRRPQITRLDLCGSKERTRVVTKWLVAHGVAGERLGWGRGDGDDQIWFNPVEWDSLKR